MNKSGTNYRMNICIELQGKLNPSKKKNICYAFQILVGIIIGIKLNNEYVSLIV